jgi:hypothetical protein
MTANGRTSLNERKSSAVGEQGQAEMISKSFFYILCFEFVGTKSLLGQLSIV